MSESNEDEKSPRLSLTSITCIKQDQREDESRGFNKAIVQKEEVKLPIACYTPPNLRNSGTYYPILWITKEIMSQGPQVVDMECRETT
jgi:hypothetical protein